jgi:hypothetical protein
LIEHCDAEVYAEPFEVEKPIKYIKKNVRRILAVSKFKFVVYLKLKITVIYNLKGFGEIQDLEL